MTETQRTLEKVIRDCPPPYEFEEAGHFVPAWGDHTAHRMLSVFACA